MSPFILFTDMIMDTVYAVAYIQISRLYPCRGEGRAPTDGGAKTHIPHRVLRSAVGASAPNHLDHYRQPN